MQMEQATIDQAKSRRLLGLFLTAALLLTSGCGATTAQHTHVDEDGDGYCDYDNEPMSQGSRRSGYYGGSYYGTSPNTGTTAVNGGDSAGATHVSQGAKGGIGSSSSGAAG